MYPDLVLPLLGTRMSGTSTRAAATSAAQRKGVKVNDILQVAGWAREATFARFYSKPLLQDCGSIFANAMLTK